MSCGKKYEEPWKPRVGVSYRRCVRTWIRAASYSKLLVRSFLLWYFVTHGSLVGIRETVIGAES
jgi:hypothetical protein